MKRREICREIREIEELIQHHNPDWPERMAAWEKQVAGDQPAWVIVRPEVEEESTGGEKYYALEDGSFLAQGYAPTKHTVEMSVKTDIAPITAFRLELLNDPNLPLSGPGRSIKGTAALTEFRVEAAPADGKGKPVEVKFSRATADVNPPETPLEPIFDDKSGKKRVTGPIGFAIDGKDETAWGIDVGPGRRNQPRKAVFTLEKPIAFPGGTILTFHLAAEPRRLEQRRQPEPQSRPVPAVDHDRAGCHGRPGPAARPGDPGDPPRETDAPPRRPPSSATGGRRSRNGRRPTPGSIRSGSGIPRASTQLALARARARAPRPTCCSGAISSSRARRSSRAFRRS